MPALRVGFYDDPLFREHDSGPGHPERPERLEAVRQATLAEGVGGRLLSRTPRPATRDELLRVHTSAHVESVASTEGRSHAFDPDTHAGPRSYRAALLAAGAAVDAVDRVLDGELDRAFCAVRPPGHHAGAERAMGFCLFNNVAVAAAHGLARGLDRVMVVDFDVHHGNGTQAIFERDPRVLYLSSHAFPFYPGTGRADEVGEGPGRGFTVNLPLPVGVGDPHYASLYREIVGPIGRSFAPQLVLVSAGFDASRGDPLAPMRLSERGFAELADVCLEIAEPAAGGRAVFVLEGGYNLEAIARASEAVLRRLLGDPHTRVPADSDDGFARLLDYYRAHLSTYWPVMGRP